MKRVKNITTYTTSDGRSVKRSITIQIIKEPDHPNLNEELQWFADSLGLFTLRDKDRSKFRIFIELLKAAKQQRPISSDELAFKLDLSRGTVMHHINNLLQSGLVVTHGRGYLLREASLPSLLESMKRDFDKAYERLYKAAEEIDHVLGK